MKAEGYLWRAAEWSVRERRDLVWWATGWEGSGGTYFGEVNTVGVGAMVGCAARRGNWLTLGGGFTLGSGTTLVGVSGVWPWTGKIGTGRVGDGTGSVVVVDRVVDGIQLEKRSRSLKMAEICLWRTSSGASLMAHNRKLSAWTMRS